MFSARINKLLLCTAAVAILSGCAIFEKKDSDEESNWLIQQFEKTAKAMPIKPLWLTLKEILSKLSLW